MALSRFIRALARFMAILGGLVLAFLTVMTVVSISGRAMIPLGLGPVPGDFEIVEAGTAFAVFAFLPWCQLNRGHATVDLFTSYLSPAVNRWIDLVTEIIMTIVFILLAWRLWIGMTDKIRFGETSFILQYPVWWGFASAMTGAAVCVIVSAYMVGVRVQEIRTGRSDFTPMQGGMH
jgi:TRAP-type C4-dicarboxylate transport system permease small subunit